MEVDFPEIRRSINGERFESKDAKWLGKGRIPRNNDTPLENFVDRWSKEELKEGIWEREREKLCGNLRKK